MIFGLNMSLNEELTVQDGRIVEGNFGLSLAGTVKPYPRS